MYEKVSAASLWERVTPIYVIRTKVWRRGKGECDALNFFAAWDWLTPVVKLRTLRISRWRNV